MVLVERGGSLMNNLSSSETLLGPLSYGWFIHQRCSSPKPGDINYYGRLPVNAGSKQGKNSSLSWRTTLNCGGMIKPDRTGVSTGKEGGRIGFRSGIILTLLECFTSNTWPGQGESFISPPQCSHVCCMTSVSPVLFSLMSV